MADDTLPVDETMRFHPADSPRGTLFYNLEELTNEQQVQLNALKIETIRDDEKYLAAHPEVRAIIAILLRVVLRHRPMVKVHEFIAKFFNRSESDIADDIEDYLETRKDHIYQATSAVEVSLKRKTDRSKREKEESIEERSLDFICAESCVCEHAMEWKSPYDPHDAVSYTETEHWLTPKSSKTSMTMDDSHHGGTSGEYFSLTDLAKMIQPGDEEEEEAGIGDGQTNGQDYDEDEVFFMGRSASEISEMREPDVKENEAENIERSPQTEERNHVKSPPNEEVQIREESPPNEGPIQEKDPANEVQIRVDSISSVQSRDVKKGAKSEKKKGLKFID